MTPRTEVRASAPQLQPRRIRRFWSEEARIHQLSRLRDLELQAADVAGRRAWEEARRQHRQLPAGVRVDLPSPRVFSRVLGVLRTVRQLKRDPMVELEVSADELAELLDYSRSTVEACLRWLGCGVIEVDGQVVARGLHLVHRARRTAPGMLEGRLTKLYRTCLTKLTEAGRLALGLLGELVRKRDRIAQQRQALTPPPSAPRPTAQQRALQALPDPGGGEEVDRAWHVSAARAVLASL